MTEFRLTAAVFNRNCTLRRKNVACRGHIVDPRTGYPVNNGCRAVSVIAPSCTIAGILTTTAMILGPQDGLHLIESHLNAEGAITTDNNRVYTRKFHEYLAA